MQENIIKLLKESSTIRKEQLLNKKLNNNIKDMYLSKIISLSKELQKEYSEDLETIKVSIDKNTLLYDSRQDSNWKKEGWQFVESLDSLLFKTTKSDVQDLDGKYHLFQAAKILISDSEKDELTKDQIMETIIPYQNLREMKNDSINYIGKLMGKKYDINIKDNAAVIKGDWRYIDELLEKVIEGGYSQIEIDMPLNKFKEKYGKRFQFTDLGKVRENDWFGILVQTHPIMANYIGAWMPPQMAQKYQKEYAYHNETDANTGYIIGAALTVPFAVSAEPIAGFSIMGLMMVDTVLRISNRKLGSFITKPFFYLKERDMIESEFGKKNRIRIELTPDSEEKYNPKSALEFIYNIKVPEEIQKNLVKDPENENFNQYGQKFQEFIHDKYVNVVVKDLVVDETQLEEKVDRLNKGFTISNSQNIGTYIKDTIVVFKPEEKSLITLISNNKEDKKEFMINALNGEAEKLIRDKYNPQYLDIRRSK